MCRGEEGSNSSFRRSSATCVSTVRVTSLEVELLRRQLDRTAASREPGQDAQQVTPIETAGAMLATGPLRRAATGEGPTAEPGRHPILVVEDHDDVREGLRELLESSGFAVEVAADGAQGIERALAQRPRVALIDLGLPCLDGYVVAERLRTLVPKEDLALVALTDHTHSEDLLRAVESGFDAYLPKPIAFDRLVAVITERLAILTRTSASS
jgi:CheY-like chemotaxis protein